MARRIVVTSGKGGVGKTTFTANLGARLAARGLRVCLLDLDLGLNNLDVIMGLENKVMFDIVDVVEGRCRLKQALVQDAFCNSLYLLPSCKNISKGMISGQNVKLITDRMSRIFDYILIDCPAGIGTGFHRAVSAADEAIVVLTPTLTSVRDAKKTVDLLESYDLMSVRTVVNRLRGDLVTSGEMMDAFEIFAMLDAQPLGIIPDDDFLGFRLPSDGRGTPSDTAFEIIATNLHEGKDDMYDCVSRYTGFFGNIRRKIKRRA